MTFLRISSLTLISALLFACTSQAESERVSQDDDLAVATFAGGCFWCMEPPFDKIDGVISTISGYTDGHTENPDYKKVSSGRTGHTEAMQLSYDPSKVSYETLLEVFWKNIDPTRDNGQFCDGGNQYRPGIYYHDEAQQRSALSSKDMLEKNKPFPDDIKVEIKKASKFYPAEEYHQDYYQKNPVRYKYYRYGCGRDKRLKELWGE